VKTAYDSIGRFHFCLMRILIDFGSCILKPQQDVRLDIYANIPDIGLIFHLHSHRFNVVVTPAASDAAPSHEP